MSTLETEVIDTPSLLFTEAAARKVGELIRGEGNPNAATTCGCGSSFSA